MNHHRFICFVAYSRGGGGGGGGGGSIIQISAIVRGTGSKLHTFRLKNSALKDQPTFHTFVVFEPEHSNINAMKGYIRNKEFLYFL